MSMYKSNDDFQESLATRFLKSVLSYPDNNALFINDRFYTYQQLWQIVVRIHQQIPSKGTFQRIGIYCSDDVYTYAAIFAVNLYGAAYVPLNNKFPITKNKKSVEQCQLKLILTPVENADVKNIGGAAHILYVGDYSESDLETINREIPNHVGYDIVTYRKVNQPIAYILFTSGSTGEPKGVPVSHSNVNSFFNFFFKNYDFNPQDKFLQVYELTFDVSVFSFFMPIMVGACCYIVPDDGIKFMKIMDYLQKYKITVVSMVPTILRYIKNYLNEITLPDLRYSFFSGDALYHNLAVKWANSLPNAAIHNCYGPTETTIVCTRYIFDEQKSAEESVNGIVPLGTAFEEMEVLIVDENNSPTEKGELCFTGKQVIANYLNNANEDKFFIYQNKRYYKTGDVASINELGDLVFHGRTDSQVKINGYRIELAEIENAVSKIANTNCVAICKASGNNINQLIVFIEAKQVDETHLKQGLSSILPAYMIPQRFIATEKFVLNMNGKVDKTNLINSYQL